MRRLGEFLRSVIPADPAQLLFVIAIVSLVIAPHLKWEAAGQPISPEYAASSFNEYFVDIGVFLLFSILFASLAGYFVCFWPGDHPTRRVLWLVFLPAAGGFNLMLGRFLYLSRHYSSVLETTGRTTTWVESLWKLPPGFHFCLMGLLLVVVFTSRLAFGIATLPLALPESSVLKSEGDGSWWRVQILVWVLVGPLCLPAWLTVRIPIILSSRLPEYVQGAWFARASFLLEFLLLGFVLWIAGRENWQILRTLIRLPQCIYFVLALAFPIGIDTLIPTGQYFVDRAAWAAHDFGKLDAPQFGSYFALPHPWLLLLFFSAFFEEVIFRGVLQRRFLQRYGLYRGMFLVGIVWAAFHFVSDFFFSRVSDQEVIFQVGFRVFTCLALNFVFGWLTLRSHSIFPAAIAHTFYNVLINSRFGLNFPGKGIVRIALWSLLAIVLFRHWTVRLEEESSPEEALTEPEPAD